MVTKVKIRKSKNKNKHKSNRKIVKLLNKKKTVKKMRGGSVGDALKLASATGSNIPSGAARFLKENPGIKKVQVSSLSKLAPDLPTGPLTPEQKQQQQLELLKALEEVARRGGQGQGQGELKGLGVPGQSSTFTVSPALAMFGVDFAAKHGSTAFSLARNFGISDNVITQEVSSALPHVKLPPGMTNKSVMNIVGKARKESLLASEPLKKAALASDTGTLKRTPGMIDAVPLKTAALAPGAPLKPIGTSTPVTGSLKRTPTPVTGAPSLKRPGSGFGSSPSGASSLKRSGSGSSTSGSFKTSAMSSAPKIMKF
jgi:hypothetical protein